MKLFNTLTKKKMVFRPGSNDFVRMYDCGPTVYFYAHIGNMWRYLISDFLRRILEYNGYRVKQVMNITDVGHLTEDDILAADTGEDKIEKAARQEKKTVWEIADHYTKAYFHDRRRLNILDPHIICKATDHIPQMIDLIRILLAKKYAYHLPDRICFDVSKFKPYGALSGKKLAELKVGARLEPVAGKKNPYDFSLWIIDPKHLMKWNSPWGTGYPGWHIECSAMSMHYLGPSLDIHTGGEDNIFPHHENEIAQSQAATGKQFVKYWVHVRHNLVNGHKMSKSKGTVYFLEDLIERGLTPLDFRYLCLTTHYRRNLNFSWPALKAAKKALFKMRSLIEEMKKEKKLPEKAEKKIIEEYKHRFLRLINDDIGTPQALALAWEVAADPKLSAAAKLRLLFSFDKVFGLDLEKGLSFIVPDNIRKLVEEREKLREAGRYTDADKIRNSIEEQDFQLKDTSQGTAIVPLTVDDRP